MAKTLIVSREHFVGNISGLALLTDTCEHTYTRRRRKEEVRILYLEKNDDLTHRLELSYFVGVDWIIKDEQAIYVEPKLNGCEKQTNYLEMLFSALKHPDVAAHTDDLFEIKWESTPIEIEQHQDLLTPLLVVLYLKLVKEIVRKGLKKSYYKVEHNLYGRVKGKVLIGKTIKENAFKNKPLNTWCSFDEFGLNGLENRLLKKALVFIQRYLPTMKNLNIDKYSADLFNYINPAFESISEDVSLHDILHTKKNAFYKEYAEAIRLAKLILQRFGYNITNAGKQTVTTPPFWIDMSKLFELYVLGLLKDRFGNDLEFQFDAKYGFPDFLLKIKDNEVIIDSKYRPLYSSGYDPDDIRQLAGYTRDVDVISFLDLEENDVIPCLIVYPESLSENKVNTPILAGALNVNPISQFSRFYKIPVYLPVIEITLSSQRLQNAVQ